jgi:hypothetical protein
MIDDESNPITLTFSTTNVKLVFHGTFKSTIPSFISIVGDTIVSNPTAASHIGVYTVNLNISDGSGLFSTQDIIINVSNSPPYFIT